MEVLKIVLILGISWAAVIWGVNLCHQRGTWFLAGWNTMRKEKRETYNEKEMCRLYGRCVVFCGVGVFLLLYGSFYDRDAVLLAGRGTTALMAALSMVVPTIHPEKSGKRPRTEAP